MEIRIADVGLADYIVRAQLAMARETEDLSLDAEVLRQGVAAVFADTRRGVYVVALDQGAPVACALVLDEWSDWRHGAVWWIHSVYVEPSHRRRGAFRAMFTWIEGEARARQKRGLRLYVDKRNARAQATYRALGMSNEHYELFETLF